MARGWRRAYSFPLAFSLPLLTAVSLTETAVGPSRIRRRLLDGPADGQSSFAWVLEPWRAYLLYPVLLSLVAIAVSFAVPNKYRAIAQVYPEQQKASGAASLGAIAGLASQIGVGLAAGAQSPQFYIQVIGSRRVMQEVLSSRVAPKGGDSVSLRDYLDASGATSAAQLDKALRRLREATEASVNSRTNIVELAVTLRDPAVATRVVGLYLDALNRFNLASRQTQAGQRRRFAEARLREAQDSLSQVDRAVSDFLTRNRQYQESPTLSFEYERLQRLLSNYQTLYTGIRRDYDTARLDEVNDTPVLTLVDPPQLPLRRASPSRVTAGLGGAVFGGLLVLFWAAIRAFLGRMYAEDRSQYDALVEFLRRAPARHRSAN
jgi:uncharacterized protein involved in exopolysaccharide biosynthesis